jgi:radical SAM protein with 4Fe4S-binding SPASM domain
MTHDFLQITKMKYWQEIEHPTPIFATFQVTAGCNLRCKYCGGDYTEPLANELTTEEVHTLIHNLKRAGTRYLSLGGGEPTLRDDLTSIITQAASVMGVGMVTNGILITEEYAQALRYAGLSVVDISLDGPTQATNDSRRGEGSYEKGIRALKNCKNAGIPVIDLQTTISQLNYKELPQMIRLALDMEVNIVVNEFIPCGRAQGREDLMLTKEQRRDMQRFLLEQQRLFGRDRIKFDGYYIISEDEKAKKKWADPEKKDFSVGDPFGIYGFNITPDGKVVPTLGLEAGDLRREELRDIWSNSEILLTLRNRERLKGKCGCCEYKYVCGGDRRRTHALTDDLMAEDPLCWYEPRQS